MLDIEALKFDEKAGIVTHIYSTGHEILLDQVCPQHLLADS